ncbi:MAG: tetratricopeptide repeat protein [Opitutus sp.]|nr:tetratricopeptide repeat protein [Opitutus sp.]
MLLAIAALISYGNTFSVPFFFDDRPAIVDNPTIRRLADWRVFSPPGHGSGVSGRPVVNVSLAINYAIGGTDVRGYHAFNLALHFLTGFTLFGLTQRTLSRRCFPPQIAAAARPLAMLVALLWTVHPLQTESVTCVTQRTELLVGLFYMLTIYFFVRGVDEASPARWQILSAVACTLGMASKEVMVTAPILVLLYDRTFVAPTFAEALRRRGRFYAGLAATWLVLAGILYGLGGSRGTAAGFGLGVPWWAYAFKQCEAVVRYLWLTLWPSPLVLDYGTAVITDFSQVWWQAILLSFLVAGSVVAFWRRRPVGFAGLWFFVVLAPSSSVVPLVEQTMSEHRVYLPTAAVLAVAVVALHAALGRRCYAFLGIIALAACGTTVSRNATYRSEMAIWTDTVIKNPASWRAHNNLAFAYADRGDLPRARAHFEQSLQFRPESALVHGNLASVLRDLGRQREAIPHFQAALRIQPDFSNVRANYGLTLVELGRHQEGLAELQEALRLDPGNPIALGGLGDALAREKRLPEATDAYLRALQSRPNEVSTLVNLGVVLVSLGRFDAAAVHYQRAVELAPGSFVTHYNLAYALRQLGRTAEAQAHFEQARKLNPGLPAIPE